MSCHLHHVHLFASNIDKSISFYTGLFGGRVVLDAELAGARNVFIRIGQGRLHLYDQPPKQAGRAGVHHLGIQTDDIDSVVANLKAHGVPLRKEVADFGLWRYVMVPAPDDVLVELFEVDRDQLPPELASYFD